MERGKAEGNAMPASRGRRRGALPGFYGRPLKRLKEIECLAHWRHRMGAYTDPVKALAVAGHALAALEGMRLRDTTRHQGLQYATAADFLDRCDLDLTEQDVIEIVADVSQARCGKHPFVMTDVVAGKLLNLTRDERTNLDIRTIEAMDEAPADRAARMAEWKRINDRLRRRRATDKKRAEKGLPPLDRAKPKAVTTKPWDALGMPKSTFYRHKAEGKLSPPDRETEVSQTYALPETETGVSQTYSATGETDVSRSFRRNIEVVRHSCPTEGFPIEDGPVSGAAPQRAASLAEASWAEMTLLLLFGRGDADLGRSVAAMIDPAAIRKWISAIKRGKLVGDEGVELESARIRATEAMRQAS